MPRCDNAASLEQTDAEVSVLLQTKADLFAICVGACSACDCSPVFWSTQSNVFSGLPALNTHTTTSCLLHGRFSHPCERGRAGADGVESTGTLWARRNKTLVRHVHMDVKSGLVQNQFSHPCYRGAVGDSKKPGDRQRQSDEDRIQKLGLHGLLFSPCDIQYMRSPFLDGRIYPRR